MPNAIISWFRTLYAWTVVVSLDCWPCSASYMSFARNLIGASSLCARNRYNNKLTCCNGVFWSFVTARVPFAALKWKPWTREFLQRLVALTASIVVALHTLCRRPCRPKRRRRMVYTCQLWDSQFQFAPSSLELTRGSDLTTLFRIL